MKIKQRVHHILEMSDGKRGLSFYFDVFIITLISLNVFAVILSTVEWIYETYGGFLDTFELFSVIIFTIEYVGRVWAITEDHRFPMPPKDDCVISLPLWR